jgi:hypothetical protein
MTDFFIFLIALAVGGVAAWQVFNWMYGKKLKNNKQESIRVEANILLEKIEQVFKVVLAEGYFTEIYDHNAKKDFWGLFKTTNKALIIVKAKVSVGYDFSKMKFSRDPETRRLVIDEFAPAEVISIDTDYKFYDINQGFVNQMKQEDYTAILSEAKSMIKQKAEFSELPLIASRQLEVMMKQLVSTMKWELEMAPLKTRIEIQNGESQHPIKD